MKFRVILEYDPVAKSFSALCPELPGCASFGDTEAEARGNVEEAIRNIWSRQQSRSPRMRA